MPQKARGGIAYIKADGVQYDLRGNCTVSPDDTEREGIAGQDGVHGFLERPRVPFISIDITDGAGVSLQQLRAIKDATVTAELANGKVYVLRNAWTSDAHEINTGDAQISVKFEGMSCRELV
ncbi:MAG TPA: phage tail tube protein [Kaistia sp.]|nr:phage tail tube protein [Kaistia sp.]